MPYSREVPTGWLPRVIKTQHDPRNQDVSADVQVNSPLGCLIAIHNIDYILGQKCGQCSWFDHPSKVQCHNVPHIHNLFLDHFSGAVVTIKNNDGHSAVMSARRRLGFLGASVNCSTAEQGPYVVIRGSWLKKKWKGQSFWVILHIIDLLTSHEGFKYCSCCKDSHSQQSHHQMGWVHTCIDCIDILYIDR